MNNKKALRIYKDLIDSLKEQDRRALSLELIKLLKYDDLKQALERKLYPPWFTIYLLKMTIQYSSFMPNTPNRAVIRNLLEKVSELNNIFDDSIKEDGLLGYIILSTHLQQQRIFQESLSYIDIGINLILFEEFEKFKKAKEWSKNKYCVKPIEYYSYLLLIYVWYNSHRDWVNIDEDDIKYVLPVNEKEKFSNFYSLLKIDLATLRRQLRTKQKSKSILREIFEEPPFYEFPIIEINGNDYLVSNKIFIKTLKMEYFNSIKDEASDSVKICLSKAFERYIKNLLDQYKIRYINENELKKSLNEQDKVVDFFINDEIKVLIEAKSIKTKFKSYHTQNEFLKAYKNSIIKAFQQFYDFSNKKQLCNENTFGIIITYDELYFDAFGEYINSVLYEEAKRLEPNIEYNQNYLSLDNIYILTAKQFSYYVAYASKYKIKIGELLLKIKNKDVKHNIFEEEIEIEFLKEKFNITYEYLKTLVKEKIGT